MTRQPKPENRRKFEIKITGTGLTFLEKIDDHLTMDEILKECLDSNEAQTLSSLLDKLRTNLKNSFDESNTKE